MNRKNSSRKNSGPRRGTAGKDSRSGGNSFRKEGSERRTQRSREDDTRPYRKAGKESGERSGGRSDERKSFSKKSGERSFDRKDKPKRDFREDRSERKPWGDRDKKGRDRDEKPFRKRSADNDEFGSSEDKRKRPRKDFSEDRSERKPWGDRDKKGRGRDEKPFRKRREDNDERDSFENKKDRPRKNFSEERSERKARGGGEKKGKDLDSTSFVNDEHEFSAYSTKRAFDEDYQEEDSASFRRKKKEWDEEDAQGLEEESSHTTKKESKYSNPSKNRPGSRSRKKQLAALEPPNPDGLTRLNKYIANTGVCSRREADTLIAAGAVTVNGKIITEMGYKVKPTDIVNYGGQTLRKEQLMYVLLNKPKDYITTADDDRGRKTVMELIEGACKERIYPVGRLDRATMGVLLFTNDGELTKRLTHPRFGIKKIYHVELDQAFKQADYNQMAEGLELEDGFVKPDSINYAGVGGSKREIGIELHSGKNRIVRRMFEHLGYKVIKLDRVSFAGLTKKNLQRGQWRFLTEKEVGFLYMAAGNGQ